jgi:hypothetical protein
MSAVSPLARLRALALGSLVALTGTARELLLNGSFDEGDKAPTGWTGSVAARWEDGGKSGKCAVLGPAPSREAWVTWKQEVKGFRPNTTYVFRAWVRADRKAFAQVVIDGLKPHKAGSSFFYLRADTGWHLWTKEVRGGPESAPTVQVMLLNEGGPETFHFDDVSFTVREEVATAPVPIRVQAEVTENREHGDLISNGRFELGDGDNPAGWSQRDPALMPRTAEGRYFHDPAGDLGTGAWERTGFSGRSLRLTVPKGDAWAGWSSQVHNLRPNCKYTVEFWYRVSRPLALRALVLGQEFTPQDLVELNPRHWWRYTATVDSGSLAGDCNIGFVAEGAATGETEVWIDSVELYEGVSPIGTNAARLSHYYYDFDWVSPDVVAPVPFAFEWCFDQDQQPDEIRYVVELPAQVELVGHYCGRLRHSPPPRRMIWTNPDPTARCDREPMTAQDGQAYVRYTFGQRQDRDGDPKSFANNGYAPVEIRNDWHTYTGMTALVLYLRTSLTEGELPPARYYAAWAAGQQTPQQLALRLTRIPKPPPPAQRLVLVAGTAPNAVDLNPQLVQDYLRFGFTGIDHPSAEDPASIPPFLRKARQAGLGHLSTWIVVPPYAAGDPEAKALALDFSRSPDSFCLEYRGADWQRIMDRYKALLDAGYDTLLFDDASPSVCHCAGCKRVFASFLRERAGLEYAAPGDFLAPDWPGDKRYGELWEDFPLYHFGLTARAMKQELQEYATAKGIQAPIRFGVSSWLGFRTPLAATSMDGFDFDSSQTYMYWLLEVLKGSPRLTGDYLRDKQLRLGDQALPLVPTISPGMAYMSPLCCLDPHEQMKYQILELMMAPKALGYVIYAGKDTDLGDLKAAAEANAILARFETVFADGDPVPGITCQGTEQSAVRAKRCGDQWLVLVSDYSTYEPLRTVVCFDLTGVGELLDVETREAFRPGAGDRYEVPLAQQRLRILYAGNRWR